MATTSATSIATALGAGSGIDMAALATNLAQAQFQSRVDRLTTRSETVERQISLASSLKNSISTLASSLGNRVRAGDLSPQPQIANGSVAKGALNGTTRPSGSYSLEVLSLARGQSLASPVYASSTAPTGSGTLTFRFGTVTPPAGADPGSFTPDAAHADLSVTISAGATLADVARAINAAGGGLNAYVTTGTDGSHLVIKGQEGAANGFVMDATETVGDPGLAALAWQPAGGDPARLTTQAANSSIKVDGLAISSASNSVTNAIPGVTLTLTGTNVGAPTMVSFTNPAEAITAAMQDLTEALNVVASDLAAAADPITGDLARDPGARALRNTLASLAGQIIMPNAPAGTVRTLSDVGLATERKGGFRLDGARLTAALEKDPAGAAAMFTNGLFGIYATIDKISRSVSASSNPGSLAGSINRYTNLKTTLGKETTKLTEQQETLRANLVSRFAVVDSRVGASRSTLSFLQSQIDAWNAGSD